MRSIRHPKYILLVALCLLSIGELFFSRHNVRARQTASSPKVNLLYIDDRAYPDIEIYLTVVDLFTLTPVQNLSLANFLATVDGNESLDLQQLEALDRPFHLMIVLDLTSSVTTAEFQKTREATTQLLTAQGLWEAQDQVGLVTMDYQSAQVVVPLSLDRNAVINAVNAETLAPLPRTSGNAVADGIYEAVAALPTSAPAVRPTVVVFTDASAGSISGTRALKDSEQLARARGINIFIISFLSEEAGDIPENNAPPPELIELAEATGGLALARDGELVVSQDGSETDTYADEIFLPEMAAQIAQILRHEYRIRTRVNKPADNALHMLTILVNDANNQVSAPAQRVFIARAGQLLPTSEAGVSSQPSPPAMIPSLQVINTAVALVASDVPEAVTVRRTRPVGDNESGLGLSLLFSAGAAFFLGIGVVVFVVRRRSRLAGDAKAAHSASAETTHLFSGKQAADGFSPVARALLVGKQGEVYPLYDGENTIGRQNGNRVQIADATVSRQHAVITIRHEVFEYRDRKTSQPSQISGHWLRPEERYPLVDGDEIRIGATMWRFMVNE